jgi:hypothetical protein
VHPDLIAVHSIIQKGLMLDNGVEHAQCGISEQLKACCGCHTRYSVLCSVRRRRAGREGSNMLCRTEEGILAHSLLLIRISYLSRKAILTQFMYRNSECVAHRGCVGGVCNVVWYYLLLLRRLFT